MAGLFGKPKKPPPPPPVPPPPPIPEVGPDVGEEAALRARRRKGFRRTILTGALEPAPAGKKRLLGGQ